MERAPTEIEITPEMMEAGLDAAALELVFATELSPYFSTERLISVVYRAMAAHSLRESP